MTNTAATDIITAHIEPAGFDGITPRFEVIVTVDRPAGICGPATDTGVVASIDEADAWFARNGFRRTGDFGEVCANGFASAPAERISR